MAKDETIVMMTGTFDPKHLPLEMLVTLGGKAEGGDVSERLRDKVVVRKVRTEVDAHLDSSVHARSPQARVPE